jgi:hypothetical protein
MTVWFSHALMFVCVCLYVCVCAYVVYVCVCVRGSTQWTSDREQCVEYQRQYGGRYCQHFSRKSASSPSKGTDHCIRRCTRRTHHLYSPPVQITILITASVVFAIIVRRSHSL